MSTSTIRLSRPKLISVTVFTVALSFALPFVFHALPQNGTPLGARFLPIFYAPLLAAALFPAGVALVASLLAPLLNHLLLGNPPLPLAAQLTAELLVFSTLVIALKKYLPLWLLAPLGYVVAKTLVFAALAQAASWQTLSASLLVALPGTGLLALLGFLISRWQQARKR